MPKASSRKTCSVSGCNTPARGGTQPLRCFKHLETDKRPKPPLCVVEGCWRIQRGIEKRCKRHCTSRPQCKISGCGKISREKGLCCRHLREETAGRNRAAREGDGHHCERYAHQFISEDDVTVHQGTCIAVDAEPATAPAPAAEPSECESAKILREELQSRILETECRNRELQILVDVLRGTVQAADVAREELLSRLLTANERIQDLQSQVEVLERDIQAAEGRNHELQVQNHELQVQKHEIEGILSDAKASALHEERAKVIALQHERFTLPIVAKHPLPSPPRLERVDQSVKARSYVRSFMDDALSRWKLELHTVQDLYLDGSDVKTLADGGWVGTGVINAWMAVLSMWFPGNAYFMVKHDLSSLPEVFQRREGQAVFIPVLLLESHYVLFMIKDDTVYILNSYPKQCYDHAAVLFSTQLQNRYRVSTSEVLPCLQQDNTLDCGVSLCLNVYLCSYGQRLPVKVPSGQPRLWLLSKLMESLQ